MSWLAFWLVIGFIVLSMIVDFLYSVRRRK